MAFIRIRVSSHLVVVFAVFALGISFLGAPAFGGKGKWRRQQREKQQPEISLQLPEPPTGQLKIEQRDTSRGESLVNLYLTQTLGFKDAAVFNTSLKLKRKLGKLIADGALDAASERDYLLKSFSKNSAEALGDIFRALGKTEYSNAIILGQAGVGKSFLINQITALFSLGIFPEFLAPELGGPNSFQTLREAFLGKADVVKVNMALLSKDPTERGKAMSSEPVRVQTVLTDLFSAAQKEFQRSGRRTIFIFDEVATLPDYVQDALKKILDETGFKNPNDPLQKLEDVGYSVLAMTTPDEYRRMVQGDSAVERRYAKVLLREPDDEEAFLILREKSDEDWTKLYELNVSDEALRFLIRMRRMLNRPPLAMPASVLAAANDLFLWKTKDQSGSAEITIRDAKEFLIKRAGLTDVWFDGPNGEPPFADLAARLKAKVAGQDEVIDKIAERLKSWARLSFGEEVPVFFIGGASGSGKDTLVKAINEVLFGHSGQHLMFSIGGVAGFGLNAIIEGPPRGNHADGEQGLLVQAMENGNSEGAIAFNEAKDAPSSELEKLKVFVESGEIRPRGQDARTRPLLFPIFIMGQWGEEYFEGKTEEEIAQIYADLSQADIEKAFLNGKEGRAVGAVSRALLDRAKRTGGVFMLTPISATLFPKIVSLIVHKTTGALKARNGLVVTVSKELVDYIAKTSQLAGEGPRGLGATVVDFTETAISEAMDHGLPQRDASITLDVQSEGGREMIVVRHETKTWKLNAATLRRIKLCERKMIVP